MSDNTPSPGISFPPQPRVRRGPGAKILLILGFCLITFFGVFAWASWRTGRQSDQDAHDQAALRTASRPATNNRAQILRENGFPESDILQPAADPHPAPPPATQQPWNPAAFVPPTPPPPPSVPPAVTAELERRKAEADWQATNRDSVDFHHATTAAPAQPRPAGSPLSRPAAPAPDYAQILRGIAQNGRSRVPASGSPDLAALLSAASAPQQETDTQERETAETQTQKQQFLKPDAAKTGDYLTAERQRPRSPFELVTGTNIPALLMEDINSDLPGEAKAQVSQDVNNSTCAQSQPDGSRACYIMIPGDSTLAGTYNSSLSYGQNRLQVVWTKLRFKDGSSIDLDRMNSHAAAGSAGISGKTDNHYGRIFAGAALTSLLAAGFQLSQNRANATTFTYPGPGQVAAASVGQEASRVGNQITARNTNIPPTVKVTAGTKLNVYINKDITFGGYWKRNEHGVLEFVEMK